VIERSKNANVVRYDAVLTANGELNSEERVTAYWILLAEDGRRAELNWVEKRSAYGFRIEPVPSGKDYKMTIAALPDRKITVTKSGDAIRPQLPIDGRQAVLERVYIQSTPGTLGPQVHYVELRGSGLQTGEKLIERIVPE
jgi:hypothetical protein